VAERTNPRQANAPLGVYTRQARDLLSPSGTLGFKLVGRYRLTKKIPTPALFIRGKLDIGADISSERVDNHGQISRSRKKNPERQDLHALQCTQPAESYQMS
jgi:hypothetical protein